MLTNLKPTCSSGLLAPLLLAATLIASQAHAIPTTYVFSGSGSASGSLTIDPALAAPAGASEVALNALEFSANLPDFGLLTMTLADFSPGPIVRADFIDGVFQGLDGFGNGTIPDYQFFLDFVAVAEGVSTYTWDVFRIADSEIRSRTGVVEFTQENPVPEPTAAALFAAGAAAVFASLRRRAIGA